MAVPTNLAEALALLTASSGNPITGQDVREVVTWANSTVERTNLDLWDPTRFGHRLLAAWRCDSEITYASAGVVSSIGDMRGSSFGPTLSPPAVGWRPTQATAGGLITITGNDSPLSAQGLEVACPVSWIGLTEITIVLVATPRGTLGNSWGDPDWFNADLISVADVPGADGVALRGTTEVSELSGMFALQGLGVGQQQILIASCGTTGRTLRQGSLTCSLSTGAMTAIASGAKVRIGYGPGSGNYANPANIDFAAALVISGRLIDDECHAIEDWVTRQGWGGSTEHRRVLTSIGDSISAGYGASPNEMWVRRLARDQGSFGWSLHAVSGYTIPQMVALDRGKRGMVLRYRRPKHVACLWGGSNSIAFGATAAATYTELQTGWEELLAAGYGAVIIPTMCSRVDCSGVEETERLAFRTMVLNTSHPRIFPVDMESLVPDHADGIHFMDAGQQSIANTISPVALTAFSSL